MIEGATSEDDIDYDAQSGLRQREEDVGHREGELDERERRISRREAELDEAQRLLEEKLGSKDVLKTINDMAFQKERQRQIQEDLRKEKQQLRQLGNKVSQEVKRAKAGILREQKKLENMSQELDAQRKALQEAHKLMNDQVEQLERISSAGSMTAIQNLSNRILDLTRQVGENASQQNALEHTAVQLKEQLNHSNQENNEIAQRHTKLKQHRDQLHEQNRTLKKRLSELELERVRMMDTEDKLLHQIEHYEQEHANSNTDLENLLHSLLDLYRERDRGVPSTSVQSARRGYGRNNLDAPRAGNTRSSLGSLGTHMISSRIQPNDKLTDGEQAMFDSINVTRFSEIDQAITNLGDNIEDR